MLLAFRNRNGGLDAAPGAARLGLLEFGVHVEIVVASRQDVTCEVHLFGLAGCICLRLNGPPVQAPNLVQVVTEGSVPIEHGDNILVRSEVKVRRSLCKMVNIDTIAGVPQLGCDGTHLRLRRRGN